MRSLEPLSGDLDLRGVDRTILGPDLFRSCRDVEATLTAARAEAHCILDRAEVDSTQTHRTAQQAGFDAGLADATAQLAELTAEAARQRGEIQTRAVELAFALTARVLGNWPGPEVLARAVDAALQELTPDPAARVAVRPQDRDALATLLGDERLRTDPALGEGTARIETELGAITISAERQLAMLRRVLEATE